MTRYHARWVLPISTAPIADGTVVEREGRIAYVGPRADAPPPTDGPDVDLGDVLLLPGLINAHCHLELTAMRGFLDGLAFREWILRLTHARRAVLSYDDLLDSARLGIEEGLRAGITTFADTGDSGSGFEAMRTGNPSTRLYTPALAISSRLKLLRPRRSKRRHHCSGTVVSSSDATSWSPCCV